MKAVGGRERPALAHTLYGRSRGKALRPGQKRLLAEALPRFSIAPEALAARSAFAALSGEVWLEIGFRAGEHIIDQAKINPDVAIVGCEPFLNGVVAALAGLERDHISNVRLRTRRCRSYHRCGPRCVFLARLPALPRPLAKTTPQQAPLCRSRRDRGAGAGHAQRRRTSLRDRYRRLRRMDAVALSRVAPFPLGSDSSGRLASALARMASDAL